MDVYDERFMRRPAMAYTLPHPATVGLGDFAQYIVDGQPGACWGGQVRRTTPLRDQLPLSTSR